ncbi:MAG: uracil-DNA glycosylase [Candidatus Desulfofervidus auxilii]|nr:uracil-DNA glycosylase [Candidatus Desulfofervidus auxilii]
MQELLEDIKTYLSWLPEISIKYIFLSEKMKDQLEELKESSLRKIKEELGECKRCPLWENRHHIVFGEGPANARLVIVGEAPGEEEDLQGKPFVGAAGELLTKMLKAINLSREEVYITNIVKCRPPNNRNPRPKEIEKCKPFLLKQLETIHPKVICTLGSIAAQTLLETKTSISLLRGKIYIWHGIKLIPTFHPAYLLRNPRQKKFVWEDLKLLEKTLKSI